MHCQFSLHFVPRERPSEPAGESPAPVQSLFIAADPYEACRQASVPAVLTEWDEFRSCDLDRVGELTATPRVVDVRKIPRSGRCAPARVFSLRRHGEVTRCVLVTGGAGFLGSHLCRALVAAGDEVVAVDDCSTGSRANLSDLEPGPRALLRGPTT